MGQKNPEKAGNHENPILAEREKRLFDAEKENPTIDSEMEMTSRTVAKEGTEDNQRAKKEDTVPTTVSPEQIFLKNGSLCRDMSPSCAFKE